MTSSDNFASPYCTNSLSCNEIFRLLTAQFRPLELHSFRKEEFINFVSFIFSGCHISCLHARVGKRLFPHHPPWITCVRKVRRRAHNVRQRKWARWWYPKCEPTIFYKMRPRTNWPREETNCLLIFVPQKLNFERCNLSSLCALLSHYAFLPRKDFQRHQAQLMSNYH